MGALANKEYYQEIRPFYVKRIYVIDKLFSATCFLDSSIEGNKRKATSPPSFSNGILQICKHQQVEASSSKTRAAPGCDDINTTMVSASTEPSFGFLLDQGKDISRDRGTELPSDEDTFFETEDDDVMEGVQGSTPEDRIQMSIKEDEMEGVTCRLETKDLWDKFHDLGTEMIITKSGR